MSTVQPRGLASTIHFRPTLISRIKSTWHHPQSQVDTPLTEALEPPEIGDPAHCGSCLLDGPPRAHTDCSGAARGGVLDPNARDDDGNTPLILATNQGYEECAEDLIKAGAVVSLSVGADLTALAEAHRNTNLEQLVSARLAGH